LVGIEREREFLLFQFSFLFPPLLKTLDKKKQEEEEEE